MIIKIKDRTYYLPKCWAEVSVSHFKQILGIKTEMLTDDQYTLQIVGVFTDLPYEDLSELSMGEIQEIKDHLSFMLLSQPSTEMKFVFELDGKTWALEADLTKLTYGQFLDLEGLIERNSENIWNAIGEILAIVIRPTVSKSKRFNWIQRLFKKKLRGVYVYHLEKYDSKKRKEYAELIETKLSIDAVNGIALFFYSIGNESMKILLDYSVQQVQDMQMNLQNNSEKSGDGTAQ